MDKPLNNKTALITGASRGIGRAIALELAAAGASIILNYVRDEDAAKKTASDLEKLGARVVTVQANVGDPDALGPLVDQGLQALGGIDILIHNAAMGAFKPTHKLKANQWDLSLDINAKAFLLLAQKVLPSMESRGGGSVIALSSLGARQFIPNYGAIGVSKAAVESLVRYLAVELAAKKIRVNGVSGGLVETDALKFFPDYASFRQKVIDRTPAGRIAQPEDLARIVKFLVLPESAWIVGQTIIADGGLSLI